jgi:hypothetical protein
MSQQNRPPNYLPIVLETARRNASKLRPGTVHEMRVMHDSWCGIFVGRVCNCNPVTELVEITGGGTDGHEVPRIRPLPAL